jgi:hypothetical protein
MRAHDVVARRGYKQPRALPHNEQDAGNDPGQIREEGAG